jgi:RNA-directed DNA polymerase
VRSLQASNAEAVIRRLNPIIRGWAAYYRSVVSKEVFSAVDNHLWGHLYRWALRTHPNKSRHWVADRYFGTFNSARNDRWVFGDRDSGRYVRQFAWTKIVRHTVVMGTASPDDPALDRYWALRRHKSHALLGGRTASLLIRQHRRCTACRAFLLHAEHGPQSPQEWEQWTRTITRAISKNALAMSDPDGDDQARHASSTPTAAEQTESQRNGSSTSAGRPSGACLSRTR